jgi:hypothetical protein
MNKRILLTGIAALLLATGAAHATGDFCAVVLKPPVKIKRDKDYKEAAWLVIRDGPGKQFLRMGKLGTGDFLWTETHCDVHSCDDGKWTHIVGIPKFDGPADPNKRSYSKGWVRSKYIQEFDCPEDQASTIPTHNGVTPMIPGKIPEILEAK